MSETPVRPPQEPQREALAEDVLGVNLRSLRSFRDLLWRPRAVFESILARDGRYTPMLRLFLALIGLQIAISVIWGGYGALAARSLAESGPDMLDQIEEALGRDIDEVLSIYSTAMSILHGPVVSGFSALSVFVLRRFGERRPLSVDLNIVFAILTTGTIAGLALMPLALGGTLHNAAILIILLTVYAVTFMRGAPPALASSLAGRIGKGVLLAAAILFLVMIAGVTANIMAMLTAMFWPAS